MRTMFYYNEQTGELEFISAGQIDPEGNVNLYLPCIEIDTTCC